MGLLTGRREVRQVFPEPPVPPYPGASGPYGPSLGGSVTAPLVVPTVWACVNLIANAVSMLPLQTFRRTNGVPTRIADSPLVASPSGDMTQSEWLHGLMVSVLLRGNAYGLIVGRDSMQRPTQIELLNPDQVQTRVDQTTGVITYRLAGVTVPTSSIWHFRGLTVPGTKIGLSPIEYAAGTLGLDLAARRFGSDYLNAGGLPVGIVTSPDDIDQPAAEILKARWKTAVANRDIAAIGNGVKFEQVQVRADESQFLQTLQADKATISGFFLVPPGMVGGSTGDSLTYSTVAQNSLQFQTFCLAWWLKRIEDAVFELLPQPQFVAFDRSALNATDPETQAKVDVQLIAGRIQTRDEIRATRNLPPMTPEQLTSLADVPELTITPGGDPKAKPPAPGPDPAATTPTPTSTEGQPDA